MILLVFGVGLWCVVHALPMAAQAPRQKLIQKMGEGGYKGLFSLLILLSIACIVFGWRGTTPSFVYAPPVWGMRATGSLMLLSLYLMTVSSFPSNVKRILRHPQLLGVALWSLAHLLGNGDSRSAVLFGGMGLWAMVSIFLINRRDGSWKKPAAVPLYKECLPVVLSVVGYLVVFYLHPYMTGVPAQFPWY